MTSLKFCQNHVRSEAILHEWSPFEKQVCSDKAIVLPDDVVSIIMHQSVETDLLFQTPRFKDSRWQTTCISNILVSEAEEKESLKEGESQILKRNREGAKLSY